MKTILVLLSLIAAASVAAAYTQEELSNTKTGLELSFKLGQAYEKASQGGDVAAFNALADQWNAWVRQHFGEDANLLMQKMTGPVDLTKPYILANNSSSGIVHKIDGMNQMNTSYTTNDVNMLPKGVDPTKLKAVNPWQQGGAEYLGGV